MRNFFSCLLWIDWHREGNSLHCKGELKDFTMCLISYPLNQKVDKIKENFFPALQNLCSAATAQPSCLFRDFIYSIPARLDIMSHELFTNIICGVCYNGYACLRLLTFEHMFLTFVMFCASFTFNLFWLAAKELQDHDTSNQFSIAIRGKNVTKSMYLSFISPWQYLLLQSLVICLSSG